jgi:hypothetical protein
MVMLPKVPQSAVPGTLIGNYKEVESWLRGTCQAHGSGGSAVARRLAGVASVLGE